MAQSTTVFHQLLRLVPNSLFDNLVHTHKADKRRRRLFTRDHFQLLLFAQWVGLKSLREIVHGVAGFIPVRRSTLDDANAGIPWTFYRDLFSGLRHLYRAKIGGNSAFPEAGRVMILDSTLIPLCLALFPWAHYRQRKGALKLHTLLDEDTLVPDAIIVTEGRVHDLTAAKTLPVLPGVTLIFDRGYFDGAYWFRLHRNGAFFVTRMKGRTGFVCGDSHPVEPGSGVRRDWTGHLEGKPGKAYPEPLRLIRFVDPETKKDMEFLTNRFDLPAQTIADLYKRRWQVELFFKWIKQHLKIKTFLGTDENTVLTQIWVAMIAYLLLRIVAKGDLTTHLLKAFIVANALRKIPLSQAWKRFHKTGNKDTITTEISARSSFT